MSDRAPPPHFLFVCMGNICRSPAAENVFLHALHAAGMEGAASADSAGTVGFHRGSPPDPRMAAALAARGIPFRGSARQVTAADIARADLVLAMDPENLADLRRVAQDAAGRAKLRLFCDFVSLPHDGEVPDPYYGEASGFDRVLDLLEDGCGRLVEAVRAGEIPRAAP